MRQTGEATHERLAPKHPCPHAQGRRDAGSILGIADRVGTIEVGKDGDLALFDGDPFQYATHCTAAGIEGIVVSDQPQ